MTYREIYHVGAEKRLAVLLEILLVILRKEDQLKMSEAGCGRHIPPAYRLAMATTSSHNGLRRSTPVTGSMES